MLARHFDFQALLQKALAGDEYSLMLLWLHLKNGRITFEEGLQICRTAETEADKHKQNVEKAKQNEAIPYPEVNSYALVLGALTYMIDEKYDKVREYLDISQSMNNQTANAVRGHMYAHGLDGEVNLEAADSLFAEGAKHDNIFAVSNLASLHKLENNPKRNEKLARDYTLKSAGLGIPDSMLELADQAIRTKKYVDAAIWLRNIKALGLGDFSEAYYKSQLTELEKKAQDTSQLMFERQELLYHLDWLRDNESRPMSAQSTHSRPEYIAYLINDTFLTDESKSNYLYSLFTTAYQSDVQTFINAISVKSENKLVDVTFWLNFAKLLVSKQQYTCALRVIAEKLTQNNVPEYSEILKLQSECATHAFHLLIESIRKGDFDQRDYFDVQKTILNRCISIISEYRKNHPDSQADIQKTLILVDILDTCVKGLLFNGFTEEFKRTLNRDDVPAHFQPMVDHIKAFLAQKKVIDEHAVRMSKRFEQMQLDVSTKKFKVVYLGATITGMPKGIMEINEIIARNFLRKNNILELYSLFIKLRDNLAKKVAQNDTAEGKARHPTTKTTYYDWQNELNKLTNLHYMHEAPVPASNQMQVTASDTQVVPGYPIIEASKVAAPVIPPSQPFPFMQTPTPSAPTIEEEDEKKQIAPVSIHSTLLGLNLQTSIAQPSVDDLLSDLPGETSSVANQPQNVLTPENIIIEAINSNMPQLSPLNVDEHSKQMQDMQKRIDAINKFGLLANTSNPTEASSAGQKPSGEVHTPVAAL